MRTRTKLTIGAVAALAIAGTAVGATAAGSDNDAPLVGQDLDRATAAALAHVGGGTVVDTESGDDGAAFGVEIQLDDGSVVEVELDAGFQVIGISPDDDTAGGDGGGDD